MLDFSLVDAQGKPMTLRLTQPHKGGKVSVSQPNDMFDTITVAFPDDHEWVYTYKKR